MKKAIMVGMKAIHPPLSQPQSNFSIPETLMFPLRHYSSSIQKVYAECSLDKGVRNLAFRIVQLAALALLSPTLLVTVPLYGVGWCWKYRTSRLNQDFPLSSGGGNPIQEPDHQVSTRSTSM
ncbi:MAG: hypothetical protein HY324_03520, partial [Chlamydiia bacterium]|nr:hypothetical protein [Chlamydiia bacterium]